MRFRTLLIILIIIVSCRPEEPGIDQVIPEGIGALWRFEISEYQDSVSTLVGTVDVTNGDIMDYELRTGVLMQNRTFRFDSLKGTSNETIRKAYYVQNGDMEISFFAEEFKKIFDEMLEDSPIDTLSKREIGGENYQQFRDYAPKWITPFRFKRSSTFSYDVHPEFPVFLNFRHEDNIYDGKVTVSTFANFLGIERVPVPFDSTVIASHIKTTTVFNFELTKNDSIPITPFRSTLVMNDWFDEEYGLVRRDREPLSIFFPDVPSRYPVIYHRGELWELLLYLPPIEEDS